MSTYAKFAAEAGDQYLEAMESDAGQFPRRDGDVQVVGAAIPATPLADFPTPQEIVDVSFGFSQRLLKQQHDFVEKLIAASEARTEPTTPRARLRREARVPPTE